MRFSQALLAAAKQWPAEGIPHNPKAWLTHVASRRMIDEIRSELARRKREMEAALRWGYSIAAMVENLEGPDDDTLILIYMCCHPVLPTSSSITLTLRAVGGLTTAEIARAFLVPEPTIAPRISRAKLAIKDSGIPFRLPGPCDRTERHQAVLHVLYLIFNESYTALEQSVGLCFRPTASTTSSLAAAVPTGARSRHPASGPDPCSAVLLAQPYRRRRSAHRLPIGNGG